jgi:uncharacterized membrane protein YcgQ (UPF0703/DUF1980 family)
MPLSRTFVSYKHTHLSLFSCSIEDWDFLSLTTFTYLLFTFCILFLLQTINPKYQNCYFIITSKLLMLRMMDQLRFSILLYKNVLRILLNFTTIDHFMLSKKTWQLGLLKKPRPFLNHYEVERVWQTIKEVMTCVYTRKSLIRSKFP